MERLQPSPVLGLFPDHRIKGLEKKAGYAFAGGGLDPMNSKELFRLKNFKIFLEGVIGAEQHSVVEMLFDPIADEVKITKVDDESILVQFIRFEGKSDGPAVPMETRAFARMKRLAVG
jgi:hypothetical protein